MLLDARAVNIQAHFFLTDSTGGDNSFPAVNNISARKQSS